MVVQLSTTMVVQTAFVEVAHSLYVSCSYWDATNDVPVAECRAEWVDDVARQRACLGAVPRSGRPAATTPTRSGRTARTPGPRASGGSPRGACALPGWRRCWGARRR